MRITAAAATASQIPTPVAEMMERDDRIVIVTEYADGWLPRAYRWSAPGTARRYVRQADGSTAVIVTTYDRKRSHGRGPHFVGFSARGGRLASRY